MSEQSNSAAKILLIVGIICLSIGLMPSRSWYTDLQTKEQVTEWRVGLIQPLWERSRRETSNGFKVHSGIRLVSWSWLPVAIGVVCFELRRRRLLKNRNVKS